MEEPNNGVVVTSQPEPVKQKKLTREELLEIENLALRTQNIALQEQRLQQDLVQANAQRHALQAQVTKRRSELSAKYSVDLSAPGVVITPQGVILEGAGSTVPGQMQGFDAIVNHETKKD
jgi:hypothetical protein